MATGRKPAQFMVGKVNNPKGVNQYGAGGGHQAPASRLARNSVNVVRTSDVNMTARHVGTQISTAARNAAVSTRNAAVGAKVNLQSKLYSKTGLGQNTIATLVQDVQHGWNHLKDVTKKTTNKVHTVVASAVDHHGQHMAPVHRAGGPGLKIGHQAPASAVARTAPTKSNGAGRQAPLAVMTRTKSKPMSIQDAADIVNNNRNKDYGDRANANSARSIAKLQAAYDAKYKKKIL